MIFCLIPAYIGLSWSAHPRGPLGRLKLGDRIDRGGARPGVVASSEAWPTTNSPPPPTASSPTSSSRHRRSAASRHSRSARSAANNGSASSGAHAAPTGVRAGTKRAELSDADADAEADSSSEAPEPTPPAPPSPPAPPPVLRVLSTRSGWKDCHRRESTASSSSSALTLYALTAAPRLSRA